MRIFYILFFAMILKSAFGSEMEARELFTVALHRIKIEIAQVAEKDLRYVLRFKNRYEEFLKPTDIDKATLLDLLSKVIIPEFQSSLIKDYQGTRILNYINSSREKIVIYPTKNFFNQTRFQVDVPDMKVIREVETLILHEISHLWGYGEDGMSGQSESRDFATELMAIISEELKVNFTSHELRQIILNNAQFYTTAQSAAYLEKKDLHCWVLADEGSTSLTEKKFHFIDKYKAFMQDEKGQSYTVALNGVMNQQTDQVIRWSMTGYTFILPHRDAYGYYTSSVSDISICHENKIDEDEIIQKFAKPFFIKSSRENFDHLSVTFKLDYLSKLIVDFYAFQKLAIDLAIRDQEQMLSNIEYFKVRYGDEYTEAINKNKWNNKNEQTLEIYNSLIHRDVKMNSGLYINQARKILTDYENLGTPFRYKYFDEEQERIEKLKSSLELLGYKFSQFEKGLERPEDIFNRTYVKAKQCLKVRSDGMYFFCNMNEEIGRRKAHIEYYHLYKEKFKNYIRDNFNIQFEN